MNVHREEDEKAVGYDYPLAVTPGYDSINAFNSTVSTDNASDVPVMVKAPTSGKKIHIVDLVISVSAAMNIRLEDSDGTIVVNRLFFSANSIFSKAFFLPLTLSASKGLFARASIPGTLSITVTGVIK